MGVKSDIPSLIDPQESLRLGTNLFSIYIDGHFFLVFSLVDSLFSNYTF